MGTAWEFATGDAETVKLWSEKTIRQADKAMFFAPFVTSLKDEDALRHPDAGKGGGIIQMRSDFKGKKGDTVTLSSAGDLSDEGTEGDGLLRDGGETLDTYTMTLKFTDIAHAVRTTGPMSDRRSVFDFRTLGMEKLSRWARNKMEGAIVLSLWGLTSWNNSGKLPTWPSAAASTVFGNSIQAFDSDHIVYAGNATSDATIDSADVLTAQLLAKLETKAFEDLSIPLEPINVDGRDSLILFTSGRGIEQLQYDDEWRAAQQSANLRGTTNPVLQRAVGRFGNIYVIEYPRTLNPAANVGRSILCGANALQMAKVEDWSWFEEYEDLRKRRKVISVGGAFGIAPTYLNSARRNAIAVDHYVRS